MSASEWGSLFENSPFLLLKSSIMRLTLPVLLLFAMVSAGCVSTTDQLPQASSRSQDFESVSDGVGELGSVNVAPRGNASAMVESWGARETIDGQLDSMWNSLREGPVWFLLKFDSYHLVERIELVVTQHRPGPTTHEIWLEDDSFTLTLHERFENVQTEDGQILEIALEPPRRINKVYVWTSQSQGWAAWWEIRVFAAAIPVEPIEPIGWSLRKVATGLEQPVRVRHAGDGSGRLFVIEKAGRVRTIRDGAVDDSSFLDIEDRVESAGEEQGLLDIVFPPTFPAVNHFYASYTNLAGDLVVSRFLTSADRERVDPDSEEVLLTVDQPHEEHNGGQMAFGPQDGYLYVGSGDGGGFKEDSAFGEKQTRNSSLLGKLLRIDVESETRPYGIPADNPFVNQPDYRPEIWAKGLRNPWGFAFDPQNGGLFIPDTGEFKEEEVNFQSARSRGGEHYGWPVWEGNYCIVLPGFPCDVGGNVLPVSSYHHRNGCAIVGGAVREGSFYFADFCRGRIWALHRRESGWQSDLLVEGGIPISSIGIDEAGELYATGYADGTLYALVKEEPGQEE